MQSENHPLVILYGVFSGRAVLSIALTCTWCDSSVDLCHHSLSKVNRGSANEEAGRAATGRTDLLNTLTALLNVHELIEEKVLYPALKTHPEAKDIVLEGYQEHHVADLIVKELQALPKDDEKWGAKFKVLKESIEHHIKEEEGEMFRTARGLFSHDELQQMGARMARMRADA